MTLEPVPPCSGHQAHYWVFGPHVPGSRQDKAICKRCHKSRSWPTHLEPNVFRSKWRKAAPKPDAEIDRGAETGVN